MGKHSSHKATLRSHIDNSEACACRRFFGVSRPAGRTRPGEESLREPAQRGKALELGNRLGDVHAATLELLPSSDNPADAARVSAELSTGITSEVDAGIATVRGNDADSRSDQPQWDRPYD